jgi:hypothetical protein
LIVSKFTRMAYSLAPKWHGFGRSRFRGLCRQGRRCRC